MEVEVAVKADGFAGNSPARFARGGGRKTVAALVGGLGEEPNVLERDVAVRAAEAVGVEAEGGGGDDAALDGETAEVAGCSRTTD